MIGYRVGFASIANQFVLGFLSRRHLPNGKVKLRLLSALTYMLLKRSQWSQRWRTTYSSSTVYHWWLYHSIDKPFICSYTHNALLFLRLRPSRPCWIWSQPTSVSVIKWPIVSTVIVALTLAATIKPSVARRGQDRHISCAQLWWAMMSNIYP